MGPVSETFHILKPLKYASIKTNDPNVRKRFHCYISENEELLIES
jgi:hypothetical protein